MSILRAEAIGRVLPVLIAALILYSQLIVPPIVGLADNGDSVNVTAPLHLAPVKESESERFFHHIVTLWKANPARQNSFIRLITSEWLLIFPVYYAVTPFTGGVFDLRWAGAVHSLVFLWALWLMVPVIRRLPGYGQLAVWAAILTLLCDVAYFSYFNTLYMDAASFVFLMLSIALYARTATGGGRLYAIAFLIALFLFITSKLQHTILTPFLVVFLLVDPTLRKALSWKSLAGTGVVMLATAYGMFQHVPEDYRAFAVYNVIFSELLPNSKEPANVLKELGLPAEMIANSGGHAFMPNSGFRDPKLRPVLLEKATHGALLRYYIRHPESAVRLVELALDACAMQREEGYGNYPIDTGKPIRATSSAYAVMSDLRSRWFDGYPWLYLVHLVVLSLACLWVVMKKMKIALAAVVVILFCAGFEFGVSALGDCKETTRHLFLFRAMMDVLLIVTVAGLVQIVQITGLATYTAYSSKMDMPRK